MISNSDSNIFSTFQMKNIRILDAGSFTTQYEFTTKLTYGPAKNNPNYFVLCKEAYYSEILTELLK